jgi:hypothetical protein
MARMPSVKAWPGDEKSRNGAPQGAVPDRKGASLREEARLMCSAARRSTPSIFEGREEKADARRLIPQTGLRSVGFLPFLQWDSR